MESDTFDLRPRQREVADIVLQRARNHDPTPVVALLAPGFGKEWAWQHAATELFRADLIDAVMTFTPRTNLCTQAETNWYHRDANGREHGRRLLYGSPVPHSFTWPKGNRVPLFEPPARGYVTTYQAAVKNFGPHEDFARAHSGRVFLVVDEAAALGGYGIGDADDREATEAADRIRRLAPHAAAVLYLTGAPDRGDGRRLILCEDRYRERDGRLHLEPDIDAGYREGVRLAYLRSCEVMYFDAEGCEVTDGADRTVTVSADQSLTHRLLVQPGVYQSLARHAVERLRGLREAHPKLIAGIACMDQDHARDVHKFVEGYAPDLRVAIAVSSDGEKSRRVLDAARIGRVDVLVFVRQAFIGFDCPAMAVLCVLTNYRDHSYLLQLCGRALRMWKALGTNEQYAYFLTLADPRAVRFFERLKTDARAGLRERTPGSSPPNGPVRDIRDLRLTGIRVDDMDGEVPEAEEALALMTRHKIGGPVRNVAQLIADVRGGVASVTEDEAPAMPLTNRERIDQLLSGAMRNVRAIAGKRAAASERPFGEVVSEVAIELSRRAHWPEDCRTEAQAQRRLDESVTMCDAEGVKPRAR